MIWFPEGYVWPRKRSAWVALLNPLPAPQDVTVTLMADGEAARTRSLTLAARSRTSQDVGAWFALPGTGDRAFGLEVDCLRCAASLVMWDARFELPAVSAPIVGCR